MDNSYFTPTVEDLPGINARAIFVPDTTTLFKGSYSRILHTFIESQKRHHFTMEGTVAEKRKERDGDYTFVFSI